MNYERLLEEVKEHLQEIIIGKEFVVKELVGPEWINLEKRDKLDFGRYFKRKVKEGNVPGVICIGKAQNNSALYKRINTQKEN